MGWWVSQVDWVWQARAEAKVQEARREESRVRLEAAQRQREVAAERLRIEAERRAAENDRIARETAANLDRMRASWADSQALQQARPFLLHPPTAFSLVQSCGAAPKCPS